MHLADVAGGDSGPRLSRKKAHYTREQLCTMCPDGNTNTSTWKYKYIVSEWKHKYSVSWRKYKYTQSVHFGGKFGIIHNWGASYVGANRNKKFNISPSQCKITSRRFNK